MNFQVDSKPSYILIDSGFSDVFLTPWSWCGAKWQQIFTIDEGHFLYKTAQLALKFFSSILLFYCTLISLPIAVVGSLFRSNGAVSIAVRAKIQTEGGLEERIKQLFPNTWCPSVTFADGEYAFYGKEEEAEARVVSFHGYGYAESWYQILFDSFWRGPLEGYALEDYHNFISILKGDSLSKITKLYSRIDLYVSVDRSQVECVVQR